MSDAVSVPRRLIAEALGSALLAGTVIGSGVMATRLTGDIGLALLGNTLATAAILYVLIVTLGPVSGAHFNPAVTLAFLIRREIGARLAAAYCAAQVAGCLLGAVFAHAMFEAPLLQIAQTTRAGPAQALSEAAATFALLFAILGGLRWRPQSVPALVAAVIAAGYWWTASTSFANPAITLARAFTDSFSGIRPADVPVFVGAQLVTATVATPFLGWLFTRED